MSNHPANNNELADFIAIHAKPYDQATDTYRRPPFAISTKAGKATAIYNAHSYHTKVPPQGIEPYISHYTKLGDLILDPFSGSGMTGVAALNLRRCVILNDLSPAAIHISYNYCTPLNISALKQEFERIRNNTKDEFSWLYGTTCDRCGGKATIQYTVWSDVFECGKCGEPIVMWETAIDENGVVKELFSCPNCGKEHKKSGMKRLPEIPVITNYECDNCKPNRGEHPVTSAEKELIAEIQKRTIPYWVPKTEFDTKGPQYRRNALSSRKIKYVTDLYTKRNLWAFARLWNESKLGHDKRIGDAVRFALTAINNYINRKQSYGGGGGGLSGMIYIPSFVMEKNVFYVFERKILSNLRSNLWTSIPQDMAFTQIGSATRLIGIPDETIDYIFTDPPFGSNLYYSEINLLWEAWLGDITDPSQEAVVHRKRDGGTKSLMDYARLMTESIQEMFRVLKPGRWASVIFHNSDDQIWQCILDSIEKSGFELTEVNAFDKEQITFKGSRGAKGLERVTNKDIVLNLRKPSLVKTRQNNNETTIRNGNAEVRIVQQIVDFLSTNPAIEQRTLQHFWNVVLYDMLTSGLVDISMEKVGNILPYYFKQVDGRWFLRGETVIGGNVFDLKTDLGAISWLSALLSALPQTTGDLIPKWQEATAASGLARDIDPGRMERLLSQNFWLDKRTNRWRIPTEIERRQMSAAEDISAEVHIRVIRRFLEGEVSHIPSAQELGAWIQFAYLRKAYSEAVGLYKFLDEPQLDPEYVKLLRKMVQVCRLKVG